MKIKMKKRYVILFVILVVYALFMYFLLGRENVKQGSYTSTFLVGDNTVWNYSDRQWLNITQSSSIKKLNWKKFTVYLNNTKAGKFYLWHDDKWYLFDNDKKAVSATGNMIAYRSNHNISIKPFETVENTNQTYITQVLEDNHLSTSSQFTVNNTTKFDIDNDGIEEDFYTISNAFAISFIPDTIFSIVFMVKDNEIYYLYNASESNLTQNGCKPYINSFIDTNEDNKYEVIVSCGRYSVEEPIDMLYQYDKDGFKMLISNQ